MSVSVLQPASATLGSFAASTSSASSTPAMNNGVQRSISDLGVAEIKEQAKAQASKVSRGASPISLITVARQQIVQARVSEGSGELKAALSAYIKAVSLVQTFMGNAEFLAEAPASRRGMLFKEFADFQANEGKDLSQRVNNVEAKLKDLEASQPGSSHTNGYEDTVDDGPVVAPGGSIADRMRALQSAGMSVNTNKRFSRDMPKAPGTPPMSPSTNRLSRRDSSHSLRSAASHSAAHPSSSTPLSPPPLQTASFSTASSSSHTFVPASSLGPPSPTSSTGSASPQQMQFSVSEFSQAFPTIDELEEMTVNGHTNGTSPPNLNGLSLQSTSARPPLPPLPQPIAASSSFSSVDEYVPSPSVAARQFPVLPTHTGTSASGIRRGSLAALHPAPSSLDTNGSTNVNDPGSPISRPSSPRTSAWVPTSPTVPRKPSNLSLHSSSAPSQPPVAHRPSPPALGITPNGPSGALNATSPPALSHLPTDKPELPHMNSVVPKQLNGYLNNSSLKVLLLDVRPREDFERESIKHPGDAVVCIDPSVLQRELVNAQSIEDSLSLAPTIEHTLFANRDKFDLVVMYDADSPTYKPALKALAAAIYETAFQKILKRMPVLLVGGLQAWKSELGDDSVLRSRPNEHDGHHRGRPHRSREHKEHRTYGSEVNGHVPGRPLPSIDGVAALRNRSQTESSTAAPRLQSIPRNDALRYTPEGIATTSRTSAPAPMRKPMSPPTQYPSPRSQMDNVITPMPQIWSSASGSIQYPSFTRNISPSITRASSPTVSTSSFHASGAHAGIVSPPPQASINPSPLSRRRSEIDQSPQLLSHSGAGFRPSIDYPDLSSHTTIRPPPPIAAPTSERQDFRPRLPAPLLEPRAPTIPSDYQVTYWRDASIATSGLKNMGNTCYMNSTIQCLNATVPFAHFFIDGHWQKAVNMLNPIGTKGAVASAFALILRDMWKQEQTYLVPTTFRRSIIAHASQFEGTEQQDCQEFLSFLLGGLHEDLNRILKKPNYSPTPEREAELERLPVQIASEQEWTIYRMRDDSLIVDFFQGQFKNRLQCMTCHHTSTTYNAFMYLTLPIPTKNSKVTLQQCLDLFVQKEVMEKDDAWNCPHCKTLRTATKQLSLSRLPPVLLIHLKRFSSKGAGADKIESFVDFPLKNLDLTSFMPDALPPGIDKGVPGAQQLSLDDPRNQTPPYKYDLYGVTNHFGTLTSGHYTAFIANRGGWMYADDSRVVPADPKDVVGKPAYVLYYKRVRT